MGKKQSRGEEGKREGKKVFEIEKKGLEIGWVVREFGRRGGGRGLHRFRGS